MARRSSFSVLISILAVTLLIGCSAGINPASPDPSDLTDNRSADALSGRTLWGLWQISVDTDTQDVEIVPLRGPSFNANVTQFLHPPISPVHMLQIEILPTSDFPNGYLEVDVTLLHPFPGLNQYRGFDVRGIFMADGSHVIEHDSALIWSDGELDEAYLLNPDGLTRWWNASEFTDHMPLLSFTPGKMGSDLDPSATLNPYKYFADDLEYDMDVAEMDTSNRGVFSPDGPTHTRLYQLQFPVDGGTPQLIFNYAVDASWDEPEPDAAPDYDISSFPDSAQVQEAYHLSVNTDGSDLWFFDDEFGGTMDMEIEVFDWQGAYSESGVVGEVSAIRIESPVLNTPVDVLGSANVMEGSQNTSSVFQFELDSSYFNIPSAGDYPILMAVESADPINYQPQLEGGDLFVFPDGPLAAYAWASVTVEGDQPWEPADDVEGDLVLAIERNTSESITGVSLDWTSNDSPFYAVYADDDPYDGFTVDIFVMEVSEDYAIVDATAWEDFSSTGAYVFGVRGRSVSEEPSSDSTNLSQLAFCDMEDFDGGTDPSPWVHGYRNTSYKWVETTSGQIDGSTSIRHNPTCPIDQWAVVASEPIPEIPESGTSFFEFAHIASNYSWLAYFKEMVGGYTHSVPPTGTSQYLDFDGSTDFYCIMDGTHDWVMPAGPPPGGGWIGLVNRFGWNSGYTFFGWRFSDCPHTAADISRMDYPDFIIDAGTIRAAMAWVTNTHTNNNDWLEVDEMAVVVY